MSWSVNLFHYIVITFPFRKQRVDVGSQPLNVSEGAALQQAQNLGESEANKKRFCKPLILTGRRILDIADFFEQLRELNSHSPVGCTFFDMDIISEKGFDHYHH